LKGRLVFGKTGMTVKECPIGDYEESRGILLIINVLMNVSEDDSLRLRTYISDGGFHVEET
jgi:hypothetical protein